MNFFKAFIYSNLFVAIVLVFFCLNTYIYGSIDPEPLYLTFIGFSSFSLYGLHGIVGLKNIPSDSMTSRHQWIKSNFKTIAVLSVVAALMAVLVFIVMKAALLWFLPAVLVGFIYVLPVFKGKRLRDLPFVKLVVICLEVTYLCVLLPLKTAEIELNGLYLLERFLFLFAVTLPFDIRDQRIDNRNGDKTLVLLIGSRASLNLSTASLFLVMLLNLHFLQLFSDMALYFYIQFVAVGVAVLFNILHIRYRYSEWQYAVFYEGSLLLPGLLLVLLS